MQIKTSQLGCILGCDALTKVFTFRASHLLVRLLAASNFFLFFQKIPVSLYDCFSYPTELFLSEYLFLTCITSEQQKLGFSTDSIYGHYIHLIGIRRLTVRSTTVKARSHQHMAAP